jgi:xanthine dehydrogenase YagR molybdenum-binding subunit
MATTAYPASALTATVRLRLIRNNRAIVETAASDIGTGMYTILTQTVADELSLPMSSISVKLGDSSLPHAPTAGRSKSTASVLPAARLACEALKKKIGAIARQHSASDNASYEELLERSRIEELVAEGTSGGMPKGKDVSFYSFGAHFVEVRIDESIGRIRVSKIVSVFDCGRIINPKTAANQIRGGIVFGLGMALMEKVEFDPNTDRIVNDNFADYRIPVNADIPNIDVLFIDRPDLDFNSFGARGLGEISFPGTAAAIGNAIFRATGKRIRKVPITMDEFINTGREA